MKLYTSPKGRRRRYRGLLRQGGLCLYCRKTPRIDLLTLEHIISRGWGAKGNHLEWNLAVVCTDCNQKKCGVEAAMINHLHNCHLGGKAPLERDPEIYYREFLRRYEAKLPPFHKKKFQIFTPLVLPHLEKAMNTWREQRKNNG